MTIALALFGIGGAIFKDQGLSSKSWPFFIAGSIFVASSFIFMLALKDEEYGFLGSGPDKWLNRGTIDGDENALSAMFAYLAYHHARRIEVSNESNRKKIFCDKARDGVWHCGYHHLRGVLCRNYLNRGIGVSLLRPVPSESVGGSGLGAGSGCGSGFGSSSLISACLSLVNLLYLVLGPARLSFHYLSQL